MATAARLRRDWPRSAGGGPAVGKDDAIQAGVKGLGGKLALQLSGTASLDAPSQIWPVPLRLLSLDVAAEVCCDAGAIFGVCVSAVPWSLLAARKEPRKPHRAVAFKEQCSER